MTKPRRPDPFAVAEKALALDLPFARSTGYGLGRSGWVTASFAPGQRVPLGILAMWLEESYRAVAPKRLAALLDR